jgi:hypothetical protein
LYILRSTIGLSVIENQNESENMPVEEVAPQELQYHPRESSPADLQRFSLDLQQKKGNFILLMKVFKNN